MIIIVSTILVNNKLAIISKYNLTNPSDTFLRLKFTELTSVYKGFVSSLKFVYRINKFL